MTNQKRGFTNKMTEGVKMFERLIAVNKLSHRKKIKRTCAVANTLSDVSCTCVHVISSSSLVFSPKAGFGRNQSTVR